MACHLIQSSGDHMTELREFEGGLKQQSRILFQWSLVAMYTSITRTIRVVVSPTILRISLTILLKILKGVPIAFQSIAGYTQTTLYSTLQNICLGQVRDFFFPNALVKIHLISQSNITKIIKSWFKGMK